MEPLIALGLACNVVQLVSFGHEVLSLARRLSKDGSPDANLADKSARLSDLSSELKDSLSAQNHARPLDQNQLRLQTVANRCLSLSNNMAEELDKIKLKVDPKGSNSKTQRTLLGQTWTSLRRKSKIQKLQAEMAQVEQTMQTIILTDMWMAKEAAALQNAPVFQGLDNKLQHFLNQYSQGHRQLSDLVIKESSTVREEVRLESTRTRVHVLAQLQEQKIARATSAQCEKLINSLVYDSMNSRKNRITESHEKTFNWIFDDTIAGPWDSFLKWLESDQRIYWINGKPGSGKSTAVKFLVDDPRTQSALSKWAPHCSIISFFLWNSGTRMQRTVQGLLCSLLHQILIKDTPLSERLISTHPELGNKRQYDDWSDTELERIMIQAIRISTQSFCIFLDGLDEIDRHDGPFYLTEIIERLQSNTNAKLCISSRPDIPLQEAFSKYPKLRLQDLTEADIASFVTDSLQKLFIFWDDNPYDKGNRQKIIYQVISSADGVFLWVHLVLQSLRRGSMHIDSYDQILARIRELPETLEGFYKRAWERLGEDESRYRAEAARYFRIVLDSQAGHGHEFFPPFSLFDLSIACDDKLQSEILDDPDGKIPPLGTFLRLTEKCRRRVESCCCGLLEFGEPDSKSFWRNSFQIDNLYHEFLVPLSAYAPNLTCGEDEIIPFGRDIGLLWFTLFGNKVEWIHRTAVDFLLGTEFGQKILSSDIASASGIRARLVRSQLVRSLIFQSPYSYIPINTDKRKIRLSMSTLRLIDKTLSTDMRQSLHILTRDTYEKILVRAPVIDHMITQLGLQISQHNSKGPLYRILCDFSRFTFAKHIGRARLYLCSDEYIIGLFWGWNPSFLPVIHGVIDQIQQKWQSGSLTNITEDFYWPVTQSTIQILLPPGTASGHLWNQISAHLWSATYILVSARNHLHMHMSSMTVNFLAGIVTEGLVDVVRKWFERRPGPGPYNNIEGFREQLIEHARTPEMRKFLEDTLQGTADVAGLTNQTDDRSAASSHEDHDRGFSLKDVYHALFPAINGDDDAVPDSSES